MVGLPDVRALAPEQRPAAGFSSRGARRARWPAFGVVNDVSQARRVGALVCRFGISSRPAVAGSCAGSQVRVIHG
jgi:hypothetical protein